MPPAVQLLSLTSSLAEIPRVADAVDAFCAPLDPGPRDLYALQLALEEAVTNVITHGYRDQPGHAFTLELRCEDRRVTAVLTDDAPAYDPLARAEVDIHVPLAERGIGGLGVHLVKKLMDSAAYERRDGRNVLTLTRAFAPPAP
ncbi:MAG: ATP-binding protein, partial [Opitutaceae bacterium]